MKFGYTIVYVPDVAASLGFYEEAFGLKRRFLHDSGTYGELDTGPTVLAFAAEALAEQNGIAIAPNRADGAPAAIEIGFVTDDVAGGVERAVQAGASLVQAPKEKPWGQIVAYVRDRDGVLVELCTAMGD